MKNIYKQLILIATLSLFNFIQAQTTLVAGDIAFSGYIAAPATGADDEFSFVILKDITANTVIKFTDYGWRTNTNSFTSGANLESECIFTTSTALVTGSEIKIKNTSATNTSGTTVGTIVYSTGANFLVSTTGISLATSGDQIFAYQGTFASPTFIAGIHMNVYTVAGGAPNETNDTSWDGLITNATYINANSSGKPVSLTSGTNCIWIGTSGDLNTEFDNARFTCSLAGVDISTATLARQALSNKSNWTTKMNGASTFSLPTNCGYLGLFSIDSFDDTNKLIVYPNPFNYEINFDTTVNFKTIELYSVLGKKVLRENFKTNINVSNLSSGIYFVKLIDEYNNSLLRKIIKK